MCMLFVVIGTRNKTTDFLLIFIQILNNSKIYICIPPRNNYNNSKIYKIVYSCNKF